LFRIFRFKGYDLFFSSQSTTNPVKFDPRIPFDRAHLCLRHWRRQGRRSIRLKGYDYRQAGGYFVTLVTQGRERLFGEVVNETMVLNDFGKIAAETWLWLETQYPYVALGKWVVMPNHFHGIIFILDDVDDGDGRGGSRSAPTAPRSAPTAPQSITDMVKRKPLGRLIGAFKTVSTKHINLARQTEGAIVWQRNYYEHILRNETELDRVTRYIASNPVRWADDNENPNRPGTTDQ